MRIHKPIFDVIVENIQLVFGDNHHIKYVIKKSLSENKKFGSRDRRFVADHTIELVRYFRYFAFLANTETDCRKVVQVYFSNLITDLPIWISSYIDLEEIEKRKQLAEENEAIMESFPDWMNDLLIEELGKDKWTKEISFLNQKALPILRVNQLKSSTKKVSAQLTNNQIEHKEVKNHPNALELAKRRDLSNLEAFKKGWFEMQDQGSQLIAPFLSPTPNSDVIDACSGAGGKALHLAEIMKNKGKITCLDIVPEKLKELEKRTERAGVKIISTKIADKATIETHKESADFLLLDVPCSGIGVLRRNPDDKWKLSKERIENLKEIQQNILQDYSSMLKKGGIMVYATCSILPSENENQVSTFLTSNTGFQLDTEQTILPSNGGDGFYMARIIRTK